MKIMVMRMMFQIFWLLLQCFTIFCQHHTPFGQFSSYDDGGHHDYYDKVDDDDGNEYCDDDNDEDAL